MLMALAKHTRQPQVVRRHKYVSANPNIVGQSFLPHPQRRMK